MAPITQGGTEGASKGIAAKRSHNEATGNAEEELAAAYRPVQVVCTNFFGKAKA